MSNVIEVEIEGKTAGQVRGIANAFAKLADHLEKQENDEGYTSVLVAISRSGKKELVESA